MQCQTTNGTVFHGIPRLAMNKFFAANLNASRQFNPIPTDVRLQLGDYHHSADEFSVNINTTVDNLSLPQQPGETNSNYARHLHAYAWLLTPLVKGESSPTVLTSHSLETQKTVDALNEARHKVFNRGLLQQLHDKDMLLFGQTMVPDQGVQIDIYGDASHPNFPGIQISLPHIRSEVYNPLRACFPLLAGASVPLTGIPNACVQCLVSRASSQTIVDPIEEQTKTLILKLKGEYDSDADDEDNIPPAPRKGKYIPPHHKPMSQHPKVEKNEPHLQFGDSTPQDSPTRPETAARSNTCIPSEKLSSRPSQTLPRPTRMRVGAAAPNPNPGDDGSSSDSQDSSPDPPNPLPNSSNHPPKPPALP